jgi:hypothetical protein
MKQSLIQRHLHGIAGFLLVLLLSPLPSLAAEPVKKNETAAREAALIDQIIKAYGGRDALAKVNSIYTRDRIKMYQQDNDGWITRYFQRPRKLRVEIALYTAPETRILNEANGWLSIGTAEAKKADQSSYEGLLFQYNYMNLPFSLIDGSNTVLSLGKDKIGAVSVDVLRIKNKEGQELALSLDEKTHLISKAASPVTDGTVKTVLSVQFSDYREVNAVKVPFKRVNYYGASPVSESQMTEVVFNKAMAEGLFKP